MVFYYGMILPVLASQKQYYNPGFKSCIRTYYSSECKGFESFLLKPAIRTTTNLFREDLDWYHLVRYIKMHFPREKKLNVYSLACSDGSEAYSYALMFDNEFMPNVSIYASDIDKEVLRVARSGKINLVGEDFNTMRFYNINPEKYFTKLDRKLKIKNNCTTDECGYEISPNIRNMVHFKQADILTELKTIKDNGNSVINIRNVLPYLKPDYMEEILDTLPEVMKPGSLFVFGIYDGTLANIRYRVMQKGFFAPTVEHNVLQRR